MLDLIGAVVGMTAVVVNVLAFAYALPGTLLRRLCLAGLAGAWVGLASGLGGAGALAFSPDRPIPLIGVLFVLPPILAAALAWRSRSARAALLAMPLPLLIGLHSLRLLGVMFLLLAAAHRLSGPFPFLAGIGDMVTGALAIRLALRVASSSEPHWGAIRSWNTFGMLDLVVAVALGVTSAPGPLQLIHAGVGSQAIQYLPYCLIPTVLVPFYLITHGIIAMQLQARNAGRMPAVGPRRERGAAIG
jgi:hypothetical protein